MDVGTEGGGEDDWGSGVWVAQEGDEIIARNVECRRKAWVRDGRVEVKARRVPDFRTEVRAAM